MLEVRNSNVQNIQNFEFYLPIFFFIFRTFCISNNPLDHHKILIGHSYPGDSNKISIKTQDGHFLKVPRNRGRDTRYFPLILDTENENVDENMEHYLFTLRPQ